MFATFPISTKLLAVVSFLLIVTAGLGGFAYLQMQSINSAAQDIQTRWLPSVRWIGEMRVQSARYRAVLRDHLLTSDDSKRPDIDKNLAARKADYEAAARRYAPLVSSPAERDLSNEVQQLWQAFIAAAEQVQTAIRAGDLAGAKDINATKVVQTGRAMDGVLSKLTELNDRGAEAAGAAANTAYRDAVTLMLAILALALVAGLCAAVYLVRDIGRGIASILTPMSALAGGDLAADLPSPHPATEIGRIAAALQVFKQAMTVKAASDEAAAIEVRAHAARAAQIDRLTAAFEAMIAELVQTLAAASTELEASATTLTTTSQTTMALSGSAASASHAVSENIQSVASATEEITSSVHEIGRQVHESTRIAAVAIGQAQKTDVSIARLSQATGRIDHVVRLITEVAEQTNLLALNATIEAARAGDAGRGFAVVASEVKALAAQTAKATDEIAAQIADMQAASAETVGTIREISTTIKLISEVSGAIAAAVEQQGAATQEIARSVQQSAQLSLKVASDVTAVTDGSRETRAASGHVLDAASALSTQSTRLQAEVMEFLSGVRAA